ncbi:MAG: winged helix-turn-helix domain-containing protein [Idiomarina sp.]|nr:winged helix-turn-helix domain-containing protein [Idiomarina sp.]
MADLLVSDNLPKLLQINEFVLDTMQQELRRGETSIPLEPRVFDVLCYLIAHHQRYVSLQELHEQVWVGRIVSDTAVRRTISKLRSILNDTERDQPLFIRSGMKRGYQWLVPPVVIEESKRIDASGAPQPSIDTTTLNTHATGEVTSTQKANMWFFLRIATTALIAIVIAVALWLQQDRATSSGLSETLSYETLLDYPGFKTSLAVSSEGDMLAFTGVLENASGLYLMHVRTGAIQRVNTPVRAVHFAEFSLDDSYLLYSYTDEQDSHLYLHFLDNLDDPPTRIDTSEFTVVVHPLILSHEEIIVSARQTASASLTYFRYSIREERWTPFNFNPFPNMSDVSARISPDRTLLAMLRQTARSSDSTIHVYDLATRDILREIRVDGTFHFLEWLNNDEIVLSNYSGQHALRRVDVLSSAQNLIAADDRFRKVRRSASGEFFGIVAPTPQPTQFYQSRLPWRVPAERLFNLPEAAAQLSFSAEADTYYLIERQPEKYTLFKFNAGTGSQKPIFESILPMQVVQHHPTQPILLLLHHGRFTVFNTDTGQMEQLNTVQQRIDPHQAFLADTAVYFSEQKDGRWYAYRYDLNSQQQNLQLEGFRYLAPWQSQYVGMDQAGQYWLLSTEFERIHKLPIQLETDVDVIFFRSFIDGDTLVVFNTELDYGRTVTVVELDTNEVTTINLTNPSFDSLSQLSVHRGRVIYGFARPSSSPIIRFDNLGSSPK